MDKLRDVKPGTVVGFAQPCSLGNKENAFTLTLKRNTSRSLDDIIRLLLSQSNMNLTPEQVRESVVNVLAVAHDEVLRGNSVSLEYLSIRSIVTGLLDDPTDSFDSTKHELKVIYTPMKSVRNAARRSSVRNMGRAVNNEIGHITNKTTSNVNYDITPGGILSIRGKRIRVIDGEENKANVFFLDDSTGTVAAKVSSESLLLNTSSHLMMVVPDTLQSGKRYRVRISTYTGATGHYMLKRQRLIDSSVGLIAE